MINTNEEALKSVNESLRDINQTMLGMTSELSSTKTNTKNLWHEVKNVRKKMEEFPNETQSLIDRHSAHCLAREKVRLKIMSESTPPQLRDRLSNGNGFYIPKWLLITFIIVGAVLVGGGIMVGAFLTDSQITANARMRDTRDTAKERSNIASPVNK